MAIPKIYKYGIEITKPWSSEMYDFNDNLREYYQEQIIEMINNLETPEQCQEIAKIVNPYGYGAGLMHDVEYMQGDMISNVKFEGNWWIKDVISELVAKEMIQPMIFEPTPEMPAISLYEAGEVMNFIGFESREEILMLRERYTSDGVPF
jgi:hypothetical protein